MGIGLLAADFTMLSGQIETSWCNPAHQRVVSWVEHLDINEVMLATSLAPDGYLAV